VKQDNLEGASHPGKDAARVRSGPTLEVRNLLSRRIRQGGDNANSMKDIESKTSEQLVSIKRAVASRFQVRRPSKRG